MVNKIIRGSHCGRVQGRAYVEVGEGCRKVGLGGGMKG